MWFSSLFFIFFPLIIVEEICFHSFNICKLLLYDQYSWTRTNQISRINLTNLCFLRSPYHISYINVTNCGFYTKSVFGCSVWMIMKIVMVIRMERNRNTDSILLFGCTFRINSWMTILMFGSLWNGMEWNVFWQNCP